MSKTIPIDRLMKKAAATGVSVYFLTKQFMVYREAAPRYTGEKIGCQYCKASDTPIIQGEQQLQCHIIGISADPYSKVDPNKICDFYKKSPYKINKE